MTWVLMLCDKINYVLHLGDTILTFFSSENHVYSFNESKLIQTYGDIV